MSSSTSTGNWLAHGVRISTAIRRAPWVESVPEHGYQGKENPQQIYRPGITSWAMISPLRRQPSRISGCGQSRSRHSSGFWTHTLEGMFSDPLHGGNAGLIGWQMIGYPGPLMSYRDEIDKDHGIAVQGKTEEPGTGHGPQGQGVGRGA